MKYVKFSDDFDWGTASSGPQSEGSFDKPHLSIMDVWYAQSPERFFDSVGPSVTCDSYHRYHEDVLLMQKIGLKSFRTSIQWTRLIKNLETGEVDPVAAQYYSDYIDDLIAHGIEPVMNLFHFDLPYELHEKYDGFKSMHVVNLYALFASKAFELYGDRVKRWITFNEPIAYTKGAYLYDFIYPNEKSFKSFALSSYHLLLAHAKACKFYRDLNLGGEIGIVVDLLPPLPRSTNPEDLEAARINDLLYNRIFMDPCVLGAYDESYIELLSKHNCLFEFQASDMELIKNEIVDFIGINYYQPSRVQAPTHEWKSDLPIMPEYFFENYDMPNKRMNKYRGWEIYPKSIYDIAMRVKNDYGNIKWYVSENGMGVEGEEGYMNSEGKIIDHYRIDFIKEHLTWLSKAIDEGSNCQGYHLWTFVDNWSWTNAYKNRYGFVSLDLKTRNRTMKASGEWISEVIANNGFEESCLIDDIYLNNREGE